MLETKQYAHSFGVSVKKFPSPKIVYFLVYLVKAKHETGVKTDQDVTLVMRCKQGSNSIHLPV